uniref:Uncharacterized protein n=1 Tax=Melopsittacus undulatus TaxID=13146 RepID=A0A8V5GSV6_MELUD
MGGLTSLLVWIHWDIPIGIHTLGYTHWDTDIGIQTLGYTHWDTDNGIQPMGYTHWDTHIGIQTLGYTHWDTHIGIHTLGYRQWDTANGIHTLGYTHWDTDIGICPLGYTHWDTHIGIQGQRQGRARFYGRTDFAPGYWFGVELDSAGGKHDGSVFGVRYFSCPPKHGVFAPPSRVQRVGGPREEPGDTAPEKKVQQVTVSQPKHNFPAVRTPKDITSESSFSRLLFCCWFPWMLRAEMQS